MPRVWLGCSQEPEAGPAYDVPGEWLALVPREQGWTLEAATARTRGTGIETNIPGALYLLRHLPGLRAGPVQSGTMEHRANADVVTFGGRSTRFHIVDNLLVLDDGEDRFWLRPREPELVAQLRKTESGWGECLSPQESCSVPEIADRYGVEWAGDLDGDGAADYLFEWHQTETFGLMLGLSRDAPAGATLRRAASLYDGCS